MGTRRKWVCVKSLKKVQSAHEIWAFIAYAKTSLLNVSSDITGLDNHRSTSSSENPSFVHKAAKVMANLHV